MQKKVISIGQCSYDHSQLSTLFKKLDVQIIKVNLESELFEILKNEKPSLIIVNRVNDSDGSSGIALIKKLKLALETAEIPIMLVSNYDDAQAEAISHGALDGFGKSSIFAPTTVEKVKLALQLYKRD